MTAGSIAVRMASINKSYPRVVANHDASLSVLSGEVHALVGENGAGKSTLMKVLYGLIPADSGTIEVRGRTLLRHSPKDAIRAGLGMVFQHFMLVPTLTVAENVVLGSEPCRGPVFDKNRAIREVERLSEDVGLPIDPKARVEDCSVGLQQRVEILKVLYRGAQVIILDEPTAVLTPQEVDELIVVVRRLASQGRTILLITHKLREVMAAADRVTVMRQGRTIETLETSRTTPDEIAQKMIGRELDAPARSASRDAGQVALSVRGLSALSDRGTAALAGIDLDVRKNEIVGIAGIEGNGQTELVECIAGLRQATDGRVRIGSVDATLLSPAQRYDAGLAHVPEDRHKRAVVLEFSVEENSILGQQRRFAGHQLLLRDRIRAHAEAIIRRTDVRPPDPRVRLSQLSGGNQQKVVVGRELSRNPKVLVACHPTRGLDVGAAEFVLNSLLEERERGTAILFVSAELSELLAISDRVVVMFGGRIAGEVDPSRVDERSLGLMMAGASEP